MCVGSAVLCLELRKYLGFGLCSRKKEKSRMGASYSTLARIELTLRPRGSTYYPHLFSGCSLQICEIKIWNTSKCTKKIVGFANTPFYILFSSSLVGVVHWLVVVLLRFRFAKPKLTTPSRAHVRQIYIYIEIETHSWRNTGPRSDREVSSHLPTEVCTYSSKQRT